MSPRRLLILTAIGGLMVLLAVMGINVLREVRALSTADNDNIQWTILQVDTEIANLRATLAEEAIRTPPNTDRVRLRTDIALSRIGLVRTGRGAELFAGNEEAQELLAALDSYATDVAAVIDSGAPLDAEAIAGMRERTNALRPDVRRLAVLGLALGAEASEQRRAEFARQFAWTGEIALALVAILTVMLIIFDRLLARARQRDADLEATTDRLASTVAASLDGIVIANEAGEIVDFNEAAEGIFGWQRDEMIGHKLEDRIIPNQFREAHRNGMSRYLKSRDPHVLNAGRIELSALRKTGEEFPVELNITSAQQGDGELFIAYLRDISEQKINEQTLIDARDRAERTDRAKSQFLAVMSHEMRTPLNGILGVLDLLRTTKPTDRQERFLQVATASGEILLEHINEALDITRIDSGAMTLTPQEFELEETIGHVVEVLRPLAQEKTLNLDLELEPNMAMAYLGDGGRIGQIVTNLIGNGIKFTDHGSVTVRVSGIHGAEQTVAKISVTDTGPGIDAEHLEDIFEDFVALSHSQGRQSRGDGLGLSISRKIARLMGGDLKVESVVGEGSCFTLTVPLERIAATDESDDPSLGTDADADAAQQSRSILVIEDNAINRSVLREMLINLGHEVTEAVNGLEGLKLAEATAFDLIVMDISMPVMDGIETTRRIRAGVGPNKETHIVGLTAHGREEYRARAEAAGMNEFCTKPIRLSVLGAVLLGVAQTSREMPPATGLIAEDVFGELLGALGPEKTRETVDRYFAELREALSELKEQSPTADQVKISQMLHKLRGATVMLGLDALVKGIDRAETANTSDDAAGYDSALLNLDSMHDDVEAHLATVLNREETSHTSG